MIYQKNTANQNLAQTSQTVQHFALNSHISYLNQPQNSSYCRNRLCPCKFKNKKELLINQKYDLGNPLFRSNTYTIETTQSQSSDQFQSIDSVNNSISQIDANQKNVCNKQESQIITGINTKIEHHKTRSQNDVKNSQTEHESVIFLDSISKKQNFKIDSIRSKLLCIKTNTQQFKSLFKILQKDLDQFKSKFIQQFQKLRSASINYHQAEKYQATKIKQTINADKQQLEKNYKRDIQTKINKMQLQIDILLQQILRVKKTAEQALLLQKNKSNFINTEMQQLKQKLIRNEFQNDILRKLVKQNQRETHKKNIQIKALQVKLQLFKQDLLQLKINYKSAQKDVLGQYKKSNFINTMLRSQLHQINQPKSQRINMRQSLPNHSQLTQLLHIFEVNVDRDQFCRKINPEITVSPYRSRRHSSLDHSQIKNKNKSPSTSRHIQMTDSQSNIKKQNSEYCTTIEQYQQGICQSNIKIKPSIAQQIKMSPFKYPFRTLYQIKKYGKCSKMTQIQEKMVQLKSQLKPSSFSKY